MFIHLGGDKMVSAKEVIAILDLSIEKSSHLTKVFIHHANEGKKMETIGTEEPKSIILTASKVYYSPISASTLKKRSNFMQTN